MFGNLFKKTKPEFFLVEQPGTRVLLLPDIFINNHLVNQVFSPKDRRLLIRLFEERGAIYMHEDFGGDDVRFMALFLNMGEKFFSGSNDLHNYPEDVREFEFHGKIR